MFKKLHLCTALSMLVLLATPVVVGAQVTTPSATAPAPEPLADTTPPTISNITSTSLGSTDATIVWTTDEPASSKFEYGDTHRYGTSASLDTAPLTAHTATLTGLQADTTYFYCIHATDPSGNTAASCGHTFTTASAAIADPAPPEQPTPPKQSEEILPEESEILPDPIDTTDTVEPPAEISDLATPEQMTDTADNKPATPVQSVQSWAEFSDANGNPKKSFAPQKENLYVRIFNPAADTNPDARDQITLTLTTTGGTRDRVKIILTETEQASGLFVGGTGFHLATSAQRGNGGIEFNGNGIVRFTYAGIAHTATIRGPSMQRFRRIIPTQTSLRINGDATHTTEQIVTLTISAQDAAWMAISNNKNFTGSVWQKMKLAAQWKLTKNFGAKTIYAKFESASGGQSTPITQTIILTSPPPIAASPTPTSPTSTTATPVMPPPKPSAPPDEGKLVRVSTQSDVYFVQNGVRHSFLTRGVFHSWFGDAPVIVSISPAELAALPLGPSLGVRPGTRLVTFANQGNVYAVEPHAVLRRIPTLAIGTAIFGRAWEQRVLVLPDTSIAYYTIGTPLADATDIPIGTLVSYDTAGHVGIIRAQGVVAPITARGFAANTFQTQYVISLHTTFSFQLADTIDGLVQ